MTLSAASPARPASDARSSQALARLQAVSGLTFFVFAATHLLNTSLAALGPAAYDGYLGAVRRVYQTPAIELGLVLAPLTVHSVASVARMRARRGKRAPTSLRTRFHRYAGYFLLVVIVGHVAAARLPALLAAAPPSFAGVASTFQFMPAMFYPYYLVFGVAGTVHAVLGLRTAYGVLGVRLARAQGIGAWLPVCALAALVLAGTMGLGGLLYAVPDASLDPFAVVVRGAYTGVLRALGLSP